jgi:hypothetical protein
MTVAARCGHKMEALYLQPSILKPHILPSSASPLLLFSLQLVLATLPLVHLSRLFRFSPSQLFLRLRWRRREEGPRVGRTKDSSHADTHDPVLVRVRVVLLDAGRDVSLSRRWNLSAITCSCAHSSPAPSWTAVRQKNCTLYLLFHLNSRYQESVRVDGYLLVQSLS